jgi:hypothetical protein
MSYVQSGLNIGGSRMSAGGSAHPSGYPVQSAGGSAHPSRSPVQATTFGRGCQEIPNTQGESSHPRSDLYSRDVRIDIDQSMDGDNQNSFPMSLAIQFLAEKDPFELSIACRVSHQNVDEALKERARQALSKNGALLERMSDRYKDDKELVLAAVKQNPGAYRHASYRLKEDPDIVAIVVRDNAHLLSQNHPLYNAWAAITSPDEFLGLLPENFDDHPGILLEAIRVNGGILGRLPDAFKNDREFVLEAIRINSNAIVHVENLLKQDTDIAVEIAHHNINLLPEDNTVRKVLTGIKDKTLIDENGNLNVGKDLIMKLSRNKSFMKLAVHLDQDCRFFNFCSSTMYFEDDQIWDLIEENPGIFKFLTEQKKDDREFVLEAVRRNAKVYTLSMQFHRDIQIAVIAGLQNSELIRDINQGIYSQITAIRRNGMDLRVASDELKNCREFVLEAVRQNGMALEYASEALREDREVVIAAVKQYGIALKSASINLHNDREIVLEAVRQNGLALQYASEALREDREVVIAAVKKYGIALNYASINLRNDREFVFEAVRQNGLALQYAPEALRGDREVVMEAVRQNGLALQYAPEALRGEREVMMEAVRQNGDALQYASEALRGEREVMREVVRQNGLSLQYASEALREDLVVVIEAVRQNGSALEFSPQNLRDDGFRIFFQNPSFIVPAIFLRTLSALINSYSYFRYVRITEEGSENGESQGINAALQNLLLVLSILQLSTLAYTSYNQVNSLYTPDGERLERMFRNQQTISWLNPFFDLASSLIHGFYWVMPIEEVSGMSLDNRHGPNLPSMGFIHIFISPLLIYLFFCRTPN